MKKYIAVIALLYCINTGLAQTKGYIIKDGQYKQGFLIENIDKVNQEYCIYFSYKNAKPDTLYPNEISEYGFIQGKSFVSKTIQVGDTTKTKFLLKEILNDETILSYSEKNIKLHYKYDGSILILINKEEYSHLKKEQNSINKKNLYEKINIDLTIGLNLGNLETNYEYNNLKNSISDINYNASLMINYKNNENWILSFGLALYQFNFESTEKNNITYNLKSDFYSIEVPVLFKYKIDLNQFFIYPNIGGSVGFKSINNNVFKSEIAPVHIILTDNVVKDYSQSFTLGFDISFKRVVLSYHYKYYVEKNINLTSNLINIGYKLKN